MASRRRRRDALKGGKGDGTKNSDFPKKQIRMGTKIEREHTKSNKIASEIARDHLSEDRQYYTKLKKAGL